MSSAGTGTYTDTKIVSITSQSATIKYNGAFLSNLRYNLGVIIPKDPDIVHRQVQLLNAQIPVSFYVINYTNNLFRLQLGAGALTTYTIPVGNYTANSLISAIKTVVSNVNFNIVISPINGLMTFSYNTTMIIANTIANSIGFILGFPAGSFNDTAFSITAPFPLNLLGIKALQVRSGNLVMNNLSSVQGGMTTLLATIPVDAVPFGMIEYKDVGNNNITIYNDFVDDLDIEIVDGESGEYINFNNADWCITLAFHVTRKIPQVFAQGSLLPPPQGTVSTQSSGTQMSKMKLQNATETQPKTESADASLTSIDSNVGQIEEQTLPSNPDLEELNFLTE